ncbi:LysE family transporter [Enterococcus casseliflavus]|uniref:LysE family transporter n=1 Tax=Enterococcus TaxID=1350 RepID=UPI001783C869|nr:MULTISPECIES: LysE family transporter [Enterococcus]MBO6385796.1 lysine transporter LysE [Enterococcus casseliflavus]QOG30525.1 LysE family transporter [Enterococcus casseliflavus]
MTNILGFISYIIVASFSPGPNALLSMAHGGKYGLRKSLLFNWGIFVGVLIVMNICAFFSRFLLTVFPGFQSVMVWIGAVYILFLAWQTIKSKAESETTTDEEEHIFFQGMLLQFVSPNTLLYGITVYASFILPNYETPTALLSFSLLLALVAFIFTACWTIFGALFQHILRKYTYWVNLVLALLLVYSALALIWRSL